VGANLEQLYEKEKSQEPSIDFQKLLNDPNLSDEQKQQLLQELMMKQGPKHGMLEVPGRDVLAGSWSYEAGDGAGGSAAAAGSAAPAAGSAGSAAAPAAGSAGSAGSAAAPAAGSGSGTGS